jgi:hypothetical protein
MTSTRDPCSTGKAHYGAELATPTRDEIERMRREMLESYAPTTKLPEETRSGVKGTVVDGDVL